MLLNFRAHHLASGLTIGLGASSHRGAVGRYTLFCVRVGTEKSLGILSIRLQLPPISLGLSAAH